MRTPTVTFGQGASVFVSTPFLDHQDVGLSGKAFSAEPVIYFNDGNQIGGGRVLNNDLSSVVVQGTANAPSYGMLYIYPPIKSDVTIDHGIKLSQGNLTTQTVNGGKFILNGNSVVTNSSTWFAGAGQYHADPTVINGLVTVSNGSSVDFADTPVQGTGTIDIESGSTVTLDRVVAGLNIDVGHSGLLVDMNLPHGQNVFATIHEGLGGHVDVLDAIKATVEIFNQSTGVLDLLNQTGTKVAELTFAGSSNLYTRPDGVGGMMITNAHHDGALPTVFTQ
jgi:hypothetical protein